MPRKGKNDHLKPPSQEPAEQLRATHNHFSRSPGAAAEREGDTLADLASKIAANVLVIVLPRSLEEYGQESASGDWKTKKKFNDMCEQLLSKEAQCMSARFVDSRGKTIFVYLGRRIKVQPPPPRITLEEQYANRTVADWDRALERANLKDVTFDGLHSEKVKAYHAIVQELPRVIPAHLSEDHRRHGPNETLVYKKEGLEGQPEETTDRYSAGTEAVALCHLVHGWIMQSQPGEGLFVSGDITHSSSSAMAAASYFHLTAPVALYLGALFKAFMPLEYEEYRDAFEAGKWVPGDPGPWLGRSIIFKLQGLVHTDRADSGPSVCFPVGFFKGGEMLVPQLGSKFLYEKGSVCLFYGGILFHKVARWTATVQTRKQQAENVTPGRIGSVFFFPTPSLELLKGKPPLWGQVTGFGRYEKFLTKGLLAKPRQRSKMVASDTAKHAEDVDMRFLDELEEVDMEISDEEISDEEISDEGC